MKRLKIDVASIQWEKRFVRLLAIESIFSAGLVLTGILTIQNSDLFLAFHILRLVVILLAAFLAYSRGIKQYYLPVLREMSAKSYWRAVFWIVIILRVPFLKIFRFEGWFGIFHSLFYTILASFVVFNLAVLYRQKYWAREYEKERRKRIDQLRVRARLSNKEFARVESLLLEIAGKQQRTPKSWLVIQLIFSLLVALLINILSNDIMNILSN